MNERKGIPYSLFLIIILIAIVLAGGLGLYVGKYNNAQNNNEQNQEKDINNIVIKNQEVKDIFQYVRASLKGGNLCLGMYYYNPYENHDVLDKIDLVLLNYATSNKIDDKFLSNFNSDDAYDIKWSHTHYKKADEVRKGLKYLYNIEYNDFSNFKSHEYIYLGEVDAFVDVMGSGGYRDLVEQVIDYNELDSEINLTVVKAEVRTVVEYMGTNKDTVYPKGIYRNIYDKNTLVYENMSMEEFKFTKENIDKFNQLKYIFKKNNEGKYYLSNIINLNYQQDYTKCN